MPTNLYISHSTIPNAGRGVFAGRNYKKGELIEECPMIVFCEQSVTLIDQTELARYYYEWGKDHKKGAIALGLGSIYNHSHKSNARFDQDFTHDVIQITAHTTIHKGEEITTNYNGDPMDDTPLWEGAL